MGHRNCFIFSVLLVSILVFSGMLFGQRVIDLDTVLGDMRVLGDDADDESGNAVAYGDINGDGYMDIIIGAYGAQRIVYGSPLERVGETYVFFGSSSPPSTVDMSTQSADIIIYGSYDYPYPDQCGWAVASGDVNGDGFDDIIIGANHSKAYARTYTGKTYVIFGSSSPPSTIDLYTESADLTVYGDDAGDESGTSVASGDINGDGYDDVIIGAIKADNFTGETYVIFGGSFPSPPYTIDLNTVSADITVYGAATVDQSGWSVASGDINGDSYNDIIIGAPYADVDTKSNAGETYVIFGSSAPPSTVDLSTESADITIMGASNWDLCGMAVASGNINGDGYDDLIIGVPGDDLPGRDNAGNTSIIFGSSFSSPPYTIDFSTQSADITINGSDEEDESGEQVSSGDVNGDDYDDVIIGASSADPPGGSAAGKTYVVFGGSFPSPPYTRDLRTQSDITVYGDDADDESGCAVAGGDINGDGYDDLIIGAHYADPIGGDAAGETYLISGGGAIITAHGLGGDNMIKAFSPLGRKWSSFTAFGPPNAQGEVHVAVGDIDGDGLDEIAAGHGEQGESLVKLFEMDGTLISSFWTFGPPNAQGEVHLAIGNFDADPSDKEIAVAQGEGGQSWVKLFQADGSFIRKFRAFGPPNAQGEVHIAAADLENSDGIDEIVAGMGEGGSSLVKIFDYMGILVRRFTAFGPVLNPGGEVYVAVGNFDADADLEIAVGTGYNGGDKVRLFEKNGTFISQFAVFHAGANTNGEVQITAADMDNDGIWEIICGHGEGGHSRVSVFKADGTRIHTFRVFGPPNAQGEVHLGKSNY